MNLSQIDRKKLIIAAAVAVVAVVALVFVLRGGRKGGGGGTAAGGFGAAGQQQAGAPAEGGGAPAAPGAPAAGQPSEQAAAGEAAPAGPMLGPIRLGRGSEVKTRPDPFITFEPPPTPPPPELVVNPPPVNLRPGGLRPAGVSEVQVSAAPEIGQHRVAGLLFNEGAYAVLEAAPGQTFVVKPGDVVQGNLITAISRDAIYLKDAQGRRWLVQLRGRSPSGAGSASQEQEESLPGSF